MKTILCAVDFSLCSENAAAYAMELSRDLNSRLILIHVFKSPFVHSEASYIMTNEVVDAQMQNAQDSIESLKLKLLSRDPSQNIETVTVEGFASEKIVAYSQKENASLVIMGTTGKGITKRLLVGSTAMQVISRSRKPVLFIPNGKKYEGLKRIVFATDLEEDNLNAAKSIVAFAKYFKSEICFLYVDGDEKIHSDSEVLEMTRKIRDTIKYSSMSGYICADKDIADGIEHFLEVFPADLLVMFTHQEHFPKSLLKPSSTKKVALQTTLPLLTLPVDSPVLVGVL